LINNNSNKIILDLCGGTGAWSEPYRAKGYDVQLITLPEFFNNINRWIILAGGILILVGGINSLRAGRRAYY